MTDQDRLELAFPFLELQDYEVVFGGISNYQAVVAAVPDDFFRPNRWSDAAMYLFSNHMTESDMEQMAGLFKTDSTAVAKAQFAYLRAWLGSFQPKHEVKAAVTGWLMSLMFTAVPQLGT